MRDATHITMLIDRSASMSSVMEVAQTAINGFLDEQKKVDGPCTLRLVDFNAPGSFHQRATWYVLRYEGQLQTATPYALHPNGNTALLDAVAMEIILTGRYLESMPEAERPDKVVFVVESDGEENSSHEYTWKQVQAMIEEQTEKYNWQFVFLGMGPDSWGQGQRIGTRSNIASARTEEAYAGTHRVMSTTVSNMRAGGQSVNAAMQDYVVDEGGVVTDADDNIIDPTTNKTTGKKKGSKT